MSNAEQALIIVGAVAVGVVAFLVALILARVYAILKDVKAITTSARRTGKVAEIVATRIIRPASAIIGTTAGVRRGAEVLMRKRRRK